MAKGSPSAFDAIYLHYFDKVVEHIMDITKDRAVAEDIVQDVFFKMWERRATFKQYEKIAGWLFVSTYNSALNHLRKIQREKHRIAHLPQTEDDNGYTIFEEQYSLVEEAIAQLPPQRKKVFELCKLEGLTYDQVAGQMNISRNTVKDHLTKAAESIRQHVSRRYNLSLKRLTLLFITG